MEMNKLGFQLFLATTKIGAENYAMGPISIYFALSVAANGAIGRTQQEIVSALGFGSDVSALNQGNDALQKTLTTSLGDGNRLKIANAVLLKASCGEPKRGFLDILKTQYHGAIFPLAEDVAKQVNDWVSDATEQKIKELISQSPGNIEAVILNAIYFKGSWANKFDAADTEPGYFSPTSDREYIQVPMMNMQRKITHYDHTLFDAIDLPYQSSGREHGLVATFLLPKPGNLLVDTLPVAFGEWDAWTKTGNSTTTVRLTVPKFKIEGSSKLNQSLQKAGVKDAFTPEADFSAISENSKGLYISDVIHKAVVEINEEGTEAAAATAIMMTRSFVRPVVVPLTFDRPFLFVIRDKSSGLVLFTVQTDIDIDIFETHNEEESSLAESQRPELVMEMESMTDVEAAKAKEAPAPEFKPYAVAVRWLVRSLSLKMKVEKPAVACCEYVISFTDDKKKTETLTPLINFLTQRFAKAQLVTLVKKSEATGKTLMLVSGAADMFYQDAEKMGLLKKLLDGELVDFRSDRKELFEGYENVHTFFSSSERQQMIRNRIFGVVAKGDDVNTLSALKIQHGEGVVRTMMEEGFVEQVFALHDDDLLQNLRLSWMNDSYEKIIVKMRNYYGEEIAFYFAWLAFYNKMILLPALLAVLTWLYQSISSSTTMPVVILFALFLSLWATLFIEFWKRSSSEYAFKWDVMEYQEEEPQRAEFKGERKVDPITGEYKKFDNVTKRYMRYSFSYSLVLLTLVIPVSLLALLNHFIFLWKDEPYLSYVPVVAHPVLVLIASKLYRMLADRLNEYENHETDSSFQNHLVLKLLLFELPNRFISLFYTAFYIGDLELLQSELIAFFVVEQLTNNVQEYLVPFFLIQFNKWRKKRSDEAAKSSGSATKFSEATEIRFNPKDFRDISLGDVSPQFMEKIEKELAEDPYSTTFDDYWEMVLQFAYVTCFATAAPAAAFFALTNNLIEWHGDAFKLLFIHQRPNPTRAAGIGIWLQTLEFFSYIAVITNCGICYYTSPQLSLLFPTLSKESIFLIVLLVEHLLIAFKSVLAIAIPDVPDWISNELKRREFLAKKRNEDEKMQRVGSSHSFSERTLANANSSGMSIHSAAKTLLTQRKAKQ